ncbi:MAG: lipoyl(octanoyl) transferase LipB [Muribaculaceae bacterium]|nr:lipoyl(octanoyl) transferase LipB [Muribaculaceae bacterium]
MNLNTDFLFAPQPYREMWERQHRLFDEMVRLKRDGITPQTGHILMLQHEPVITLGRHGNESNLLMASELERRGIECIRIERGGDITYHGPGQLVTYLIIDLEQFHLGIKSYINLLEEAVIRTLDDFAIKGERVEGATGVWIGAGTPQERKICAIGVKCSRYVTMHGLALNVSTDLDAFRLINPCGFTDKGVTSIEREWGDQVMLHHVAPKLDHYLRQLLQESASGTSHRSADCSD